MAKATDRARDAAPLGKKLDELYELIDGIEIAMFTTRRPDGHLVSRPDGHPDAGRGQPTSGSSPTSSPTSSTSSRPIRT